MPMLDFPFPGATTIPLNGGNRYDARGYGVELSTTWDVTDFWRLTGGYTLMKIDMDADKDSLDTDSENQEDDTPRNQFFVQSRLDLPWDLEFDTSLFWVGKVENQDVGSYTRLDLRLGWQATPNLELSVVGQNLTEGRHMEYGPSFTRFPSAVPRSVYSKVSWRY
jgi:iron complex outermembrane receptor protein